MAKKTDKIIEVFSTIYKKPELSEVQKQELSDVNKVISELASNPNPQNRYEISQIVAYTVDTLVKDQLNYLPRIADVRYTDYQERPKFKIKKDGIKVFWQAIGATPERSKVAFDYVDLKLQAITSKPYIEWADLASGRYDFSELVSDVLVETERSIAKKVQSTLYSAFSGLSSPNFASGSGFVKASFDPLLFAMRRFGQVSIVGDLQALAGLIQGTGFVGTQGSQKLLDEQNANGYIGRYLGSDVVVLNNPIEKRTGFNTVLKRGYIYIVPSVSPELKPVKIQFAGDTMTQEGQNLDDGTYEMRFDKLAGVGVVGDRFSLSCYEDTSL